MKRIIVLIAVLLLMACVFSGCADAQESKFPTTEEVREIIPSRANLSLQKYPMLNMPMLSAEEYLATLPEEYLTFRFKAEDWTEDTAMTKYYEDVYSKNLITSFIADKVEEKIESYDFINPVYIPSDGSKEKLLTVYEDNSCDLSIGLLSDDGEGNRTYREHCCYGKDGKLQYYYNTETEFLLDITMHPDEHQIGVLYEDIYYEYHLEFDRLDHVNATQWPLMDYDAEVSEGFRLTFYPQAQAYRDVCYEYCVDTEEEYYYYIAYYTSEGELESINYYNDNISAAYDKDYQLIEEESSEFTIFDYLKDLYF